MVQDVAGNLTVRRMRKQEALAVGQYHEAGIPTGVLADLGAGFMSVLYRAINESDKGFVFVAVGADERVLGFICGTTDFDHIFKRVLLHSGWRMLLHALKALASPRVCWRAVESMFYSSKMPEGLPEAELLSVVVAPEAKGAGAAGRLMQACLSEFHDRGIDQIRVMVRADFDRANAYYQKHGFQMAGKISSHGHPSNVLTRSTEP